MSYQELNYFNKKLNVQEAMCLLEDKVNELIEVNNAEHQDHLDMMARFKEIDEFIAYLQGAGLEKEVRKVMDVFVLDGTFEKLINEKVLIDINDKVDSFILATDAKLEGKRDKAVLLTQTDLSTSSEAHKLTPNHLNQEIKDMMTGSTPVSPNIADGQITTEKIANFAVETEKVSSIEAAKIVINATKKYGVEIFGESFGLNPIQNGVNISQQTGSNVFITINCAELARDCEYEFSFNYKANKTTTVFAGYWRVFTDSISEETINFGPTLQEQKFVKRFFNSSNITRIEYVIINAGAANFNVDFTNIKSVNQNATNIIDYVDSKLISEQSFIMNTLHVSKSYSDATPGFGNTHFNSLITAHNFTNGKSSEQNRYTILVQPGTYSDFETVYAGSDSETGEGYLGIRVNDYVYFETTEPEKPEKFMLKWDGSAGFSPAHNMTTAQTMRRCIFHLDKRPLHTHIKGFTINSSNTRYCVHPETAGTGYGNEWLFENCVMNYGGAPRCSTYNGAVVGIGISAGEIGRINKCKFTSLTGGIVGHNNGFAENQWNATKPFWTEGSKLSIENCDLGGLGISQSTLVDSGFDGFDILTVRNCTNVSDISLSLQGSATKQKWKLIQEATN